MGKRKAKIWGDAFGEIGFEIDFSRSIRTWRVNYRRRQRHLVGNEWIGCQDRCREKTVACEAVGNGATGVCKD